MMSFPADFQSLRQRVDRYLRRRVADAHLVEDLTQEVMLKLHLYRDRVPREPARLVAWALRAARNAAIDQFRSSRSTQMPLDPAASFEVRSEASTSSASTELASCLPWMVRHLPAKYRKAIELTDLEQRPQHDVSRTLGISLSGAKSRVQRGRQQLRSMIAQCCTVELGARGEFRSIAPTERSAAFCKNDSEKSCVL